MGGAFHPQGQPLPLRTYGTTAILLPHFILSYFSFITLMVQQPLMVPIQHSWISFFYFCLA